MNNILSWFNRILSETDGTPSSKRLGYVFVIGILSGVTVALTVITCSDPHLAQDALKSVVGWLASAGGFGYVGGKFADRGQNDSSTPTQ